MGFLEDDGAVKDDDGAAKPNFEPFDPINCVGDSSGDNALSMEHVQWVDATQANLEGTLITDIADVAPRPVIPAVG